MNLSSKILSAILKGLYEGLSKYNLTMLDDEDDSVVVKNDLYKHLNIYDDLIDRLSEFLDDDKMFKGIVEKIISLNKQYTVKDKDELKLLVDKTIEVFGNECDLNWIDTSLITDMSNLFFNKHEFNGHIENWDVSKVENMNGMFAYVESFNQPIGSWDVSNVENMSSMFSGAKSFNQPIGNWDVSNVEDMSNIFSDAKSFNQYIGNWDVSKVEDMDGMFSNAKKFNKNISKWNMSHVSLTRLMFNNAKSFNQPIGNWNTSNITLMFEMFYDAKSFNQDISKWKLPKLQNANYIFINCPIKEEYKPKKLRKIK